jgi:hypothetical protein
MYRRTLWLFACLALCASCRKFVEGQRLFRDMMVLRGQIASQFHEARVQVNVIGNGTVVVTFINSPLNSASPEEKQKRADDVAAFVMANCKQQVPEVRTFFVTRSEGSVTGLDRYTGHPKQGAHTLSDPRNPRAA